MIVTVHISLLVGPATAAEAPVRGPVRLLAVGGAVGRVPAAVVDGLRLALPAPLLLLQARDLAPVPLVLLGQLHLQVLVEAPLHVVPKPIVR